MHIRIQYQLFEKVKVQIYTYTKRQTVKHTGQMNKNEAVAYK